MPNRNNTLTNAREARQDEFYTQYYDIEREVVAYLDHNPDVFRGKTVLLPCDYLEWSNFTKYCDAIEVSYSDTIPADYTGLMDVPLSFLDKHCVDQYDTIGLDDDKPIWRGKGLSL